MSHPYTPEQAVERIRLIADEHRDFTEDIERAVRYHGVGPALLEELTDLKLPSRGTGADRRFDRLDLENIGIMLWLRCPRRSAMRWWSRSFSDDPEATYEISLAIPSSPAPPVSPASWLTENASVTAIQRTPSSMRLTVRRPGGRVIIEPPYADLLGLLADVHFHLLPPGLESDLGFLAETRLANCSLGALHLTVAGAERGMRVRTASGLLLATPFSMGHVWVTVPVGGRWVAADPLLLAACARWGLLDPAAWPIMRSPQVALWEIGGSIDRMLDPSGPPRTPSLRTSRPASRKIPGVQAGS